MCVVDSVQQRKKSVHLSAEYMAPGSKFELFGYDFTIGDGLDEQPEVWLIEVNSSPACDYSTPVTCPLVRLESWI